MVVGVFDISDPQNPCGECRSLLQKDPEFAALQRLDVAQKSCYPPVVPNMAMEIHLFQ